MLTAPLSRPQMRAGLTRLRRWLATDDGTRLALLLVVALLVRLVFSPFHGFFHDLQAYVNWGRLLDHDFFHFYGVASTRDVAEATKYGYLPNYPPLTVYLYGVLDAIYFAVARLFTPHPTFLLSQSPLLAVYMRLPMLTADLGTTGVIYVLARRLRSSRWALLAAGTYAFSPAILFDGALWGQTDSIFTLVIVLALLCTLQRRGAWAGAFVMLALLQKPQPIIFAPLIPLYLYRWAGWRVAARALIAMAGTAVAVCLPFLLPPHPQILIFVRVVQQVAGSKPYATVDAFNLWWFLGAAHHNTGTPYLGPLSPTGLGLLLFALVFLIATISLWRDRSAERFFLSAALVATAFYTVTTLQHERYLYPALALFLIAALYNTRHALFYGVATLTAFLNMAMEVLINANPPDGFPADPGVNLSTQQIAFIHTGGIWTLLIAAVNVWLLLVLCVVSLRTLPRQAAPAIVPRTAETAMQPTGEAVEAAR